LGAPARCGHCWATVRSAAACDLRRRAWPHCYLIFSCLLGPCLRTFPTGRTTHGTCAHVKRHPTGDAASVRVLLLGMFPLRCHATTHTYIRAAAYSAGSGQQALSATCLHHAVMPATTPAIILSDGMGRYLSSDRSAYLTATKAYACLVLPRLDWTTVRDARRAGRTRAGCLYLTFFMALTPRYYCADALHSERRPTLTLRRSAPAHPAAAKRGGYAAPSSQRAMYSIQTHANTRPRRHSCALNSRCACSPLWTMLTWLRPFSGCDTRSGRGSVAISSPCNPSNAKHFHLDYAPATRTAGQARDADSGFISI